MDVLLAPIGSFGDVLPFCALGRVLASRGCSVAVAANPCFAVEVKRARLDFVAVGSAEEYERLTADRDVLAGTRGFAAIMRYVRALEAPLYAIVKAHRPHKIVAHPFALAAPRADDELGIEAITMHLSPAILQSAHLPPVMPGIPNGAGWPRWYKRAVAWAADTLILPRWRGSDARPSLALFPEWFAPRQPDWPPALVQTDFPAQAGGRLPRALDGFLDGDAIVFTPGSGNRHARRFFETAIAASARLKRRAILLTRFAEQLPPSLPPHVRHAAWAPLSSLLPHAAALVHHGGIGTLAAALGAGVPQLVMPLAHDQPDNAARLSRLGVALQVPPHEFEAPRVTAALQTLTTSPQIAARCRATAARMAGRDGLAAAADVIFTATLDAGGACHEAFGSGRVR